METFNISKDIWSLSFFHLRSSRRHCCRSDRISTLIQGWDFFRGSTSFRGAIQPKISEHLLLKDWICSSTSKYGVTESEIGIFSAPKYCSEKTGMEVNTRGQCAWCGKVIGGAGRSAEKSTGLWSESGVSQISMSATDSPYVRIKSSVCTW